MPLVICPWGDNKQARGSQEEPGGDRWSQVEPGGARRSQEKPGEAKDQSKKREILGKNALRDLPLGRDNE